MPASTAPGRGAFVAAFIRFNTEPMKAMPLKEQRRVEETAPGFAQAVQRARDISGISAEPVPVSLTEFYDNAVLLYLSLWYADTLGVRVIFEPTDRRKKPRSTPAVPSDGV